MKPEQGHVRQIAIDLATNRLRLDVDGASLPHGIWPATLDIGPQGRLIALEFESMYLEITPTGVSDLVRSAEVTVQIDEDGAVWLDRRGPGYELSFPSGNQCWQTSQGRSLCSVLI